MRPNVVATMRANCAKLGVLDGTIDAWMSDVVAPWFDALEAHLGDGYLLGGRPSLADFAIYGANVAHFVGDPVCRDLVDAHSPAAVAHTHRLSMPQRQTFGDWATSPADSLIPVIAQMGRHYLPWVATATVDGSATVRIGEHAIEIRSSNFLDNARGVLLARYAEARANRRDPFFIVPAGGADICNIPVPVRTSPAD